jgi:hypothetical protein
MRRELGNQEAAVAEAVWLSGHRAGLGDLIGELIAKHFKGIGLWIILWAGIGRSAATVDEMLHSIDIGPGGFEHLVKET